jgi:3-hydroxybutyryl-CoA dehydrogenase
MIDIDATDFSIGVIGAGTMGRGIAQIAAAAGIAVLIYDERRPACEDAVKFVDGMFRRAAEKNQMTADAATAATRRIKIADSLEGLASARLVIEAVVEELAVKQALFGRLEAIVAPDCVLASNTSSLSITAIAAACKKPDRVAGYHFFNPVPLMKLVEVVAAPLTDPAVPDALTRLAKKMGHTPVNAQDTPGFIVNHAGRGLYTEGMRIHAEGVADFATIDRILREACGFRMGPFELMDTTGLDVSGPVSESIYRQYYEEPRVRPAAFMRPRIAAGLLGRKAGRGFYAYDGAKKIEPPEPAAPAARAAAVWTANGAAATRAGVEAAGVPLDRGNTPGANSLCIVTPLGEDATSAALAAKLDPRRTVALDTLFGLDGRRTIMTTPATEAKFRDQAHALFAHGGNAVSVIRDSAGFVAQRTIATIVNIAADMAQQRIATPADIDAAVRIGLAYPKGPLAWGDALGPARILQILEAMLGSSGDPRYRPSPWLKRRAQLGLSLTVTEG